MNFTKVSWESEEDEDYEDLLAQADDLFSSAKIRPSRFESNYIVAFDESDWKVKGALAYGVTEVTPDLVTATFSLVVAPSQRRAGLARRLVRELEKNQRYLAPEGEDLQLEADVVNPVAGRLLLSMGFESPAGKETGYMFKILEG